VAVHWVSTSGRHVASLTATAGQVQRRIRQYRALTDKATCLRVRDPKRLRRAAKIMEGIGQRMQYSVFRCWMNPTQMQRLRWELTEVLQAEDDVLIIPLCTRCVEGMETTHSAHNVPNWPDSPEPYRVV
jgi:CRISPR-associated protein Cas2